MTTRNKDDIRKLIQAKTYPVCGKKHFISYCPLLREAGYTTTYNNPNSSTSTPLEETNSIRAAALRVPQTTQATDPTETLTSEGMSCVSLLSSTSEQQIFDRASPMLQCTHNLDYLDISTQNNSTSIEENDSSMHTLDQIYVSSHEQASVPDVVDSESNTYNAMKEVQTNTASTFRTSCMGRAATVQSPTDRIVMVVDSGATAHMNPFCEAFTTYKPLPPGNYVELANGRKVPAIGIGKTLQKLDGHVISLMEVLHVPQLHSPLLSVRTFRRRQGCAFFADESICCLIFPTFFLDIKDDKDCVLPYSTMGNQQSIQSNEYEYEELPAPQFESLTVLEIYLSVIDRLQRKYRQ